MGGSQTSMRLAGHQVAIFQILFYNFQVYLVRGFYEKTIIYFIILFIL